jgi:hypothetical protein
MNLARSAPALLLVSRHQPDTREPSSSRNRHVGLARHPLPAPLLLRDTRDLSPKPTATASIKGRLRALRRTIRHTLVSILPHHQRMAQTTATTRTDIRKFESRQTAMIVRFKNRTTCHSSRLRHLHRPMAPSTFLLLSPIGRISNRPSDRRCLPVL